MTERRRVRVLIADDSAICRAGLRIALEEDGDITVVGEAEDAESAVSLATRLRPDLVTMDIQMPGDGLRAIERIMAEHPLPILVVTGLAAERPELAFEATRRGALDVCGRPSSARPGEKLDLRRRVRRLASLPVVRHVGTKLRTSAPGSPSLQARRARASFVAIASSAGGPGAVAELLRRIGPDFQAPIALVQHLSAGFTQAFGQFLGGHTKLAIEIVQTTVEPRARTVYLAAPNRHLVASGSSLTASSADPVAGYRPSADVLFESLAITRGVAVAAVVLSGLGSDGAEGLARLRSAGALTLVQDPDVAIVGGMPRAAIDRGAAMEVLGLEGIAAALVAATQSA